MAAYTDNRRRSPRLPAHLAVTLQPLTAQRAPLGPLIDGVAVDLSQGGVCIISDHPLLSDLVLVELQAATSEQTVRLVAQRIRCRRKGPMFEIALRFTEKISDDNVA